MIIFLAYEGFELIASAAGDARSVRELELSYYISVVIVIIVYILIAIVSAGILTPGDVEKYRDYALAVVAERLFSRPGFYLVVAAALASTGSAINATLYGNARISYMIAKYGQAPRFLERRVWKEGHEGLLIVSTISLALALGAGLDSISVAGSSSFLLVFTAVNIAAYRLRRKIKASPVLPLVASGMSASSLVLLLAHTLRTTPGGVLVFLLFLAGSFAAEALYRYATGRRLRRYLDERLERRERLVREWNLWLPRLVDEIRRLLRDVEVYLVGGVARGEVESSHDVDILLVVPPGTPREAAEDAVRAAMRRSGIPEDAPLDLHLAEKGRHEEALARSRKYRRLH